MQKCEQKPVKRGAASITRKIDAEMKEKLAHLHELMSQEGLDELVQMINKCTEAMERRQHRSDQHQVRGRDSLQVTISPINQNDNAAI